MVRSMPHESAAAMMSPARQMRSWAVVSAEGVMTGSDYLDVVGGVYLDGGGEYSRKFDEEPTFA